MSEPDLPRPEDFRFRCPVEVRFRDLDAMGHVNNAAYFTFFEIARTGYVQAIGHGTPATMGHAELFPFILLAVSCRFLAPAGLADVLRVHLRTTRIGTKSFGFEYLVTGANGAPVAVGQSTQVYYDYAAAATSAIPAELVGLLRSYEAGEI